MEAQIQELSLYIKNCAKCIACIISSFLTIQKIDIFSLVYMREMMLAELELKFKPNLADFHVPSVTLCHLL